jgi:hypothetical protein
MMPDLTPRRILSEEQFLIHNQLYTRSTGAKRGLSKLKTTFWMVGALTRQLPSICPLLL